jgi:LysM repeat protein
LAQGIVESAFGNSSLATQANNHFAIKCGSVWTGDSFYREDDDYDALGNLKKSCFRKYNSPNESFQNHTDFLRGKRYAALFELAITDYQGWSRGLQRCGYATAPDYAEKLIITVEKYELYKYDTHTEPPIVHLPPQNPSSIKGGGLFGKMKPGMLFNNNVKAVILGEDETLASIASANDLPVEVLKKYNDMNEGQQLIPYQFVYLEPKRHWFKGNLENHIVREGENMYQIAQFYGIKLNHLLVHNQLLAGEEPRVGSEIQLKMEASEKPPLRVTIAANTSKAQSPSRPSAPPSDTRQIDTETAMLEREDSPAPRPMAPTTPPPPSRSAPITIRNKP